MNVSVGERWESFVEQIVKEGRYASVSEVVREGLRLVEEREARLRDLRSHVRDAIAKGGESSEGDIDAAVKARLDMWEQKRQAAS